MALRVYGTFIKKQLSLGLEQEPNILACGNVACQHELLYLFDNSGLETHSSVLGIQICDPEK